MLTNTKKFSTIAAALVIAAFSIYATSLTFSSTNQTAHQETITLNMQSGAQVTVTLSPGESTPTQLNGDNVVGLWLYGAYDAAGANAVISTPNGDVVMMWQMSGGTPVGCCAQPDLPGGSTLS